jgi:hypothetical protein
MKRGIDDTTESKTTEPTDTTEPQATEPPLSVFH